jgi:hypothetical protein
VCLGFVVVEHLLGRGTAPALRARLDAAPAVARGLLYATVAVYLLLFMPRDASSFVYRAF